MCAAIFGGYAVAVLHAFLSTGPQVRFPADGDTIAYLRMAAVPVFSRQFLAGERAFGYALLLKSTGLDLAAAGYVQTLVSIGAWGFLAWAVRHICSTGLGKDIACAAVLLCALREEVLVWNSFSLSESLAFSSFAVWVGSWIMFARGRHRVWRLLPLATSFFFAFVRDSNAFLVLGAALLLAGLCACRIVAPRHLLLSLALVCLFLGSQASRVHSLRSLYSFQNLIGGRILVDDWRIAALQRQGMYGGLAKDEIAALAGLCGNQLAEKALELSASGHGDIDRFHEWAVTAGTRDYLAFLLRNPDYLLFQPFREEGMLRFLFPLADWVEPRGCSAPLRTEVPHLFQTMVPEPVRGFLRGTQPGWFLILWSVVVLECLLVFGATGLHRGPLLITLALLLSSIPHLLVVWHGDALDVPRHAVLAGVQVHLAFALALAFACDAIATLGGAGANRLRVGAAGVPPFASSDPPRAPGAAG